MSLKVSFYFFFVSNRELEFLLFYPCNNTSESSISWIIGKNEERQFLFMEESAQNLEMSPFFLSV